MAAVWLRLRSELRTRWRAWLALALIFGIGSGAAIASLAGARRTDTAYPRLVDSHDGFDAFTGGGAENNFAQAFARLKAHPAAASAEELIIVGAQLTLPAKDGREERVFGFPDAFVVSNPSGRVLYQTNRAKVLEGRLPDKADPHEVAVPFTIRDRFGVGVGDQLIAGIGFDEEFAPVEQVPVRVVGIVAAPGDFEAVGQTLFLNVYGTPALFERYGALIPMIPDLYNLGFHLRGGPDAAVAFKQSVEREFSIDVPVIEPVVRSGVQKTMRLYAVALWVVGTLVAVATVAIVGQTLARQTTLDSSDGPTLRALGFSPARLVGLAVLRSGLIGLAAAVTAGVVAFAASPFFPLGPARIAEPSPGFAFDVVIVGVGAAIVILLAPLISLVPSIRAIRTGVDDSSEGERGSRLARVVSTMVRGPATAAGIRMALEPGRGRTAVPVRSTILAVALGIAAVTGSLVFGESLTNLIDDPTLAGFTYDALLPSECPPDPDPCTEQERERFDAERAATLRGFPFVDRLARGTALNVVLGGSDSFLLALEGSGEIGYAIIDGRAPTDAPIRGLPQIALGQATMRRMGLGIGETVELVYPYHEPEGEGEAPPPDHDELRVQRAAIVGVAAIPSLPFAVTEPGEGAIMSVGGVAMFEPDHGAGCCFVAFDGGTDISEARVALEAAGFEVFLRTERADLATLERLSRLPILLSIIFAIIGAAALAHVTVTVVRRRRMELAILKTLGFVKRQVRTAVAWQISTIVVLAVVVGIPSGVALGRWGWGLVAGHFAVVSVPVAPVLTLALVVPSALVLGNLVAAIPGRIAARTQPAIALRTE